MNKQLSFKDDEVIRILNIVYILFKEGRFTEATHELEQALGIDFDYPGVASSLKCANYWQEKAEKAETLSDLYEKGEYLLTQWRHFTGFTDRIGDVSEQCLFNIKHYVFSDALRCFLGLYEESGIYDRDVLLRIGRCHKGIGNYEKAIEFLETAGQQKSESPEILAELADCYALVNEMRASKIFFREAFFLDPQGISLSQVECGFMNRLADKLRERGFSEPELLEWIPVYATIYGVFNIKRELRPIEYGKLKQGIFKYESEIRENGNAVSSLIPRLINNYFWLIDHYVNSGEEKKKIDEILMKIKTLDPVIYKDYTK